MFINVGLGASAYRALSIYIYYASHLVGELVCEEELRAVTAQLIASVTVGPPGKDLQPSTMVLSFLP